MAVLNPDLRLRRSSRIVLIDPEMRVLLFRFDVAGRAPFWVTPGGECEADESYEDAARRELSEETGIDALPGQQIARTIPEFVTPEGELVQADERYFLVRAPSDRIDTSCHTELERKVMTRHRWFTLRELCSWDEAVYPSNLADLIRKETGS